MAMEENGKKPLTAKTRGPFHFLRVAFYMLRRRSRGKSAVQVVEKSAWRRIMCMVRPLQPRCLQPPPGPVLPIKDRGQDDSFYDIGQLPPPASPDYTLPRVYEDGMSSRYTSAEDLQELGGNEGVVDDLKEIDEALNCGGDHPNEIDMQAEEFIAKFYEQMRLQRVESLERYNNWLEKQAVEDEEKEKEKERQEEKEEEENKEEEKQEKKEEEEEKET